MSRLLTFSPLASASANCLSTSQISSPTLPNDFLRLLEKLEQLHATNPEQIPILEALVDRKLARLGVSISYVAACLLSTCS